ncbi:MAG TPA: hypothetical protein VNS10_24520 [Gemmatimonadaceae bacterium]|jgi:hypothetical protein|nr:hypothetical protein [Gemmatimonadaceae bacterium]
MAIPGIIKNHKLVTIIALVILIPILIFVLWASITLNYTYSSGERAGFLQKVSKKGWVCKTWEGEIQLTAMPGAAPEIFTFTVRSDSLAQVLNKLNGQKVVLDYKQHIGVPTSCFGETEYFVVGARAVGQ